jgi:hypothetical protein
LVRFSGIAPEPWQAERGSREEAPLKALEEGAYIKHFQYGLGVVTESNSDRTSIDFDLHGVKKFVTSIMVVDAAEGTPPKRRRAKKLKKLVTVASVAGMAAGVK